MGKIVVKRFANDRWGAGAHLIARWANEHNASVISQSVSRGLVTRGWIIVTFELEEKGSFESSSTFTPISPSTTIREATDEELREMAEADRRLKTQERNVTIKYLDDRGEAQSEKSKKKRWLKRR